MSRTLVAVALLACSRPPPPAPPPAAAEPSVDRHAAAIASGRERLKRILAEDQVPGLSVAVLLGDEVVWSEGFGFADLDARRPVTAETRFRLASVSKLVTIAALGRLLDAGKLDLDAPAGASLPELPAALQPITARQLAGHLGGVRHYQAKDLIGAPRGPFASVAASLEIFAGDPLVAPPGTRYAYSTYGYVLLSALLEQAGGEPFLELVRRTVTDPLRLSSLGPDDGSPDPRFTQLYAPTGRGPVPAPRQDQSARWAGGGLRASAVDVARLVAAHRAPGYLGAPTLGALFTGQRTAGGEETGVGLGWRISTDERGRRYVHHAGNMAGSRSLALLFPEQGLAVAILTNLSGTPAKIEALGLALAAPFLP